MLRSPGGNGPEDVIEKLGPDTLLNIGESVRVKFPGWLYIPGTVVPNQKGTNEVAVKFDTTAGPDIKYYPRNNETTFQRHWDVTFEHLRPSTQLVAGERLLVVMPDGLSFAGKVEYVSVKPELSHTFAVEKSDGTTDAIPLVRTLNLRICRLPTAQVQPPAPMLPALQAANTALPSLTSLATAAAANEEEEPAKRTKLANSSNTPK